jgi:hypothetical protein
MPHDIRRKKRKKKPNRSQPLGISEPHALLEHRELAALRIAGAARPGAHREELLVERYDKLEQSRRECEAVSAEDDVITRAPSDPRKERRRAAAMEREVRRINSLPMTAGRLDAIREFIARSV